MDVGGYNQGCNAHAGFTLKQKAGHPRKAETHTDARTPALYLAGDFLPKLVWRPRWGFTAGLTGGTNKRTNTKDDCVTGIAGTINHSVDLESKLHSKKGKIRPGNSSFGFRFG